LDILGGIYISLFFREISEQALGFKQQRQKKAILIKKNTIFLQTDKKMNNFAANSYPIIHTSKIKKSINFLLL
jgi:hypothetical protein